MRNSVDRMTEPKQSKSPASVSPPWQTLRKGDIVMVSESREIEDKEKDEGSLSIFIVRLERWEIVSAKAI
jgi:hypothetical protein